MALIEIPGTVAEGNKASTTFTAAALTSLNTLTLLFQDTNNVQYSAAVDTSVTVANSTAVKIGASGASTLSDLAQAVHRSIDQAVRFGVTSPTANTANASDLLPVSLGDIGTEAPSAVLNTATAVAGKAVLTISGDPADAEVFTLVDSDGTSQAFTINRSSTASTATVGVQSVLGSNSNLATKVAACINSISALDITATANSPSSGKVLLVQGTSGTNGVRAITENVTNFAFAGLADGSGIANTFQEVVSVNGLTLILADQFGNSYSATADSSVAKANSTAIKIGVSDVSSINDLAESIHNSLTQAITYGVTSSVKDTTNGSSLFLATLGTRSNNSFTITYNTKGIVGEGNNVSGTLVSGSHASLAATFAMPAKAVMTISGNPSDSETFVITDTAGTSQTFTIDTSTDTDSLTAATATIVFTDKPNEESTISVEDSDGTTIVFEIDNENDGAGHATAAFTFSDKPNEGSTITIRDSDGTALVFEIDNEANGVSGSNIAVNGIAAAGGGATGTAADLVAKINAQSSLDVVATNPGTGQVLLKQSTSGTAGNTSISLDNATHWNTTTSVNVPSAFTGGNANVALNGIAAAGGGATGTAADLAAKINAQSSLDIVASNPSSGTILLTQGTKGRAGNTGITTGGSTWSSSTSSLPSAFTGGVDGGTIGIQSDLGTNASIATSIAAAVNAISGLNITATANSPSSGKVLLVQDTTGSAGNRAITDNLTNVTFGGLSDGSGTANKFLNCNESFTVTQSVPGTEGNNTPSGTLLSGSKATMAAFSGGTGHPNALGNSITADQIQPSFPSTGAVLIHGMQVKSSGAVNHIVGVPFTVLKQITFSDIKAAVSGSNTSHTFDVLQVSTDLSGWQCLNVFCTVGTPFSSSGITIKAGVVSTYHGTDDDAIFTAQAIGSAVSAGAAVGHLNAQKGALTASNNNIVFANTSGNKITVTFNDSAALSGLTAGVVNVYVNIILSPGVEYS